jgi:hypothetical protein
MTGLYIEQRALHGKAALSWDLVHHLFVRPVRGRVVIVTERPVVLLATTKRQWYKLLRQVQLERSSTLQATRIAELSRQIAYMQNLSFTTKPAKTTSKASVLFAIADELTNFPPVCQSLYVTYELDKQTLHTLTRDMLRDGVIVLYR